MQPPLLPTGVNLLRRALAVSLVLHLVIGLIGALSIPSAQHAELELVDIEVAPPPPEAEALPPEVARPPEEDHAASQPDEPAIPAPPEPGDGPADAGVDGPRDAPPDAPPDAPKPVDAAVDAELQVASTDDGLADGGIDDATAIATVNAGSGSGSAAEGSGSGDGSSAGSGSIATAAGSGSGVAGMTTDPAVDGAPTTAGTAANLLTYFPSGHVVTALIRFDRLRGTEWAAHTERLLQPMPDYRVLFGAHDAKVADKLDTLVISTPRPRDATATTLVARTQLSRAALREFLGATSTVTWSPSRGGLLGKRTGNKPPGDQRVFLSPFKSWFLLAQPADLAALMAPAGGNVDTIEAKVKLPSWLSAVRTIEAESGTDRGPALVVTVALGAQRFDLKGNDFGLGVKTVATPERISLAMELVKQGWLVRGNMRFASESDALEFIRVAESARQQVANSRAFQLALGKQVTRVIKNLSFAHSAGRVSYATSVSIADARAILDVIAQSLDRYYGNRP
ncbi:MAG: hypothetical protein AB7P03_15685 [Kofleriaceae bacterium]